MLNVLLDNLWFIIIGGTVIFMIILSYFLFVRPSSYVKEDEKEVSKVQPKEPINPERRKDAKHFENYLLNKEKDKEMSEEDHEEDDFYDMTEDQLEEDVDDDDDNIKTADQLLRNLEKKNKEAEMEEDELGIDKEAYESDEEDLGKYHILYREKDDMWYVKRANSDRTIRVLHTKKEAIAYATIKAINQDSNIVIHGKDGKIEKHGY